MRGALFGSVLILAATILLALATCSVPLIKSIYFLTARIGGTGNEAGATITLGALGYCIGTKCQGPTIGYSFDPTQVLGIATSVEGFNINSSKYSTAVIKGLTYTLVLHPVALAACVLTLITGILANCGDLSLKCLNSVFSSLASAVTLIALGCDFALFIIAQKRINGVSRASASLGNALWLVLIAWICIFVSSFFFCCGSSGRGSGGGKGNKKRDDYDDDAWKSGRPANGYADQMRMDALDAESQRKNQNALPKFATYETEHVESMPLKHDYEGQMGAGTTGYNNVGGHGAGGDQYGYADGGYANYAAGPEHAPYGGYPAGGPNTYIPGVGPGAPRAVPAATSYHDGPQQYDGSQYHDNSQYHDSGQYQDGHAIGYAHNGNEPSTYPGYHDDESVHSYGAPLRAASYNSHSGGDGFGGMEQIPPVPAIPSHIQQSSYGSPSPQSGHPIDYSGATFGEGSHISTSPSPYEAIQQATAAGQRSRALPREPTQADDGFGLSVLQAGQAAAAVKSTPNRYDSPGPTSPSRALPRVPGRQGTLEPPDYESEYAAAYDGADYNHDHRYERR